MIDMYDHPMSAAEKEQLYQEGCAAYRAYGVSDRVVPKDWPSFEAWFDRMCRERLEVTPAARRLVEFAKEPPASFPLVPQALYRVARKPSAKPLWWHSLGTLPPVVRELIGERWTDRDERRHQRIRRTIQRTWPLLPARVRYTARARAGYRRVGIGPLG
jgi:uncharacterized protein (DUF2236 family)